MQLHGFVVSVDLGSEADEAGEAATMARLRTALEMLLFVDGVVRVETTVSDDDYFRPGNRARLLLSAPPVDDLTK